MSNLNKSKLENDSTSTLNSTSSKLLPDIRRYRLKRKLILK